MGFIFKKIAKNDGIVFEPDIKISTEYDDLTVDELCEMFKSFLQACSFPVDFTDRVELLEEKDEYKSEECTEKVELDLSDHEFGILAKIAHEKDITLNQLINEILKETIVKEEEKLVFDNFVDELTEADKDNPAQKSVTACQPNADSLDFVEKLEKIEVPEDNEPFGEKIIPVNETIEKIEKDVPTIDKAEGESLKNIAKTMGVSLSTIGLSPEVVKNAKEHERKTLDELVYDDEEYLD